MMPLPHSRVIAKVMNLSEEQKLIRDTVRDFVQDRIAPFAAEWDKHDYVPAQELKQMGELGLFGIAIPETWGGSGADYVSFALVIEEVAAGDGACSTILSVNNTVVCGSLLGFGSKIDVAGGIGVVKVAASRFGCRGTQDTRAKEERSLCLEWNQKLCYLGRECRCRYRFCGHRPRCRQERH